MSGMFINPAATTKAIDFITWIKRFSKFIILLFEYYYFKSTIFLVWEYLSAVIL